MDAQHPWKGAYPCFRLYGNVYFAGTAHASTHLIDTGDGLLMLDSGYQESLYLVLDSIRQLGFRPQDIRWILHSHGHIDHAGASRALVELVHAKTYIGERDVPIVTGERPLAWNIEYQMGFSTFEPDVALKDGDVLHFGNTTVECVATPGHTPGDFSFFWNAVGEDGRVVRAGTMGGAGLNTLAADYIHQYHLEEEDWRGDFSRTLQRCKKEQVELFIGNHKEHNQTPERYARLMQGERDAFLDQESWGRFLAQSEEKFHQLLQQDPL